MTIEAIQLLAARVKARNLLAPKKEKNLTKDDNSFGTPPEIFLPLHEEFQFTIDAMASKENALLPRYWSEKENALKQSWENERVFCNPPYSRGMVKESFLYASMQCRLNDCRLAVLLIPTYTERDWFHDRVHHFETRFIKGRIQFIGGASGARGNHMLVIFRNASWIW